MGAIYKLNRGGVSQNRRLIEILLILFLHHFTSKETYPDDYYVEDGPQGRFIVDGSNVYGLADLYRTPDVLRMAGHLKTNGLSL